jgi:glutamate/tyrosine decarboxylase-like PLP-dependent enzyme
MSVRAVLERTAAHAADYLESLDTRPVAATRSLADLRADLGGRLPEAGMAAEQVVDELVHAADGGMLGSAGGRFFGWVIGGSLPAALAADWLTAAWDQNAATYACGPAEAVIEEVAGGWLKELLSLPAESSFAFTTGAQMAHVTALAAARSRLLSALDWDVERRGLAGAPAVRVLTGGRHHASIDRAIRLLGFGLEALRVLGTDEHERVDLAALERELADAPAVPTVVCLQAGEINTGAFDPFAEACELAHARGAWVHVDGAFGLWARVSDRFAYLTDGVDQADSWTTDGHKWLNVPFDSGFAFVRHHAPHRAAMTTKASYLVTAKGGARDQIDWNPEWSRRGRGVAVYAAIRSLGRDGIRGIVERCSDHAHRLVTAIGGLHGAELLVEPQINQGLVRFLATDGDHDRHTDEVIQRIQATGEAWFGGTTWNGMRAMRVSVVNWQTSERDVDRAVAAVRSVLGGDDQIA